MANETEFPASARRKCCYFDIVLYTPAPSAIAELAKKMQATACPGAIVDHVWFFESHDAPGLPELPCRGFFCEEHSQMIHKMPTDHACHPVGADCAMPGAEWDRDAGRCWVPDDPFLAVDEDLAKAKEFARLS